MSGWRDAWLRSSVDPSRDWQGWWLIAFWLTVGVLVGALRTSWWWLAFAPGCAAAWWVTWRTYSRPTVLLACPCGCGECAWLVAQHSISVRANGDGGGSITVGGSS